MIPQQCYKGATKASLGRVLQVFCCREYEAQHINPRTFSVMVLQLALNLVSALLAD
jgi:hypothetical protein